jgi:hypothetical protein
VGGVSCGVEEVGEVTTVTVVVAGTGRGGHGPAKGHGADRYHHDGLGRVVCKGYT